MHSISYTKLAPGWVLIWVNFDPIQEIELKVGARHSFEGGCSLARLQYIVYSMWGVKFWCKGLMRNCHATNNYHHNVPLRLVIRIKLLHSTVKNSFAYHSLGSIGMLFRQGGLPIIRKLLTGWWGSPIVRIWSLGGHTFWWWTCCHGNQGILTLDGWGLPTLTRFSSKRIQQFDSGTLQEGGETIL